MTFLIDPFLLIGLTIISMKIGDRVDTTNSTRIGKSLAIFSLLVIIFTSSSLYINAWWMDWFWEPIYPYATSGKDLMINSGIFSFNVSDTEGIIDTLAFLQIAIYPLWTLIGHRLYGHMSD